MKKWHNLPKSLAICIDSLHCGYCLCKHDYD